MSKNAARPINQWVFFSVRSKNELIEGICRTGTNKALAKCPNMRSPQGQENIAGAMTFSMNKYMYAGICSGVLHPYKLNYAKDLEAFP